MSLKLTVTPDRFALIGRGWLVVDGVPYVVQREPDGSETPIHTMPPPALSALAGKACGCECHGHNRPYPDMHDNGCPPCSGSGAALVTVTTECEILPVHPRSSGAPGRILVYRLSVDGPPWMINDEGHVKTATLDYPDGTRSLRVKLTGEALPIMGEDSTEEPSVEAGVGWITVYDDGEVERFIPNDDPDCPWYMSYPDLGPDPAQYIGWFAFPCKVVR